MTTPEYGNRNAGDLAELPPILTIEQFEAEHAPRLQAEAEAKAREEEQLRQQRDVRAFPPTYYEEIRAKMDAEPPMPEPASSKATYEILEHNYDGIQEYDNPTPGWWYAMFWGTVAFSMLYVVVYHMSTLVPTLPERLASAEQAALEERFAALAGLPEGEAKILTIMAEDSWLEQGASVFQARCALCHTAEGNGLIGPNLTDDRYRHVTSLVELTTVIRDGTPGGAMPSQAQNLKGEEVYLVSAYVASLRGLNLPTNDGVNPDYTGVEIDPWPMLTDDGDVVPAPPPSDDRQASAGS
ncbi:MAG: cbb3-type cytochrome c oxidase N-terminal domain-containing protein [Planctomycetota bacterium]